MRPTKRRPSLGPRKKLRSIERPLKPLIQYSRVFNQTPKLSGPQMQRNLRASLSALLWLNKLKRHAACMLHKSTCKLRNSVQLLGFIAGYNLIPTAGAEEKTASLTKIADCGLLFCESSFKSVRFEASSFSEPNDEPNDDPQ